MTTNRTYPYDPDTVSPPGDTLLEALAQRAGVPDDLAQRVIVECAPISADDAHQLFIATGIPVQNWLCSDCATSPGDVLIQFMARRVDLDSALAQRVVVACAPINADDGRSLYFATGIPTDYWLRHDELFREALAKGKRSTRDFTDEQPDRNQYALGTFVVTPFGTGIVQRHEERERGRAVIVKLNGGGREVPFKEGDPAVEEVPACPGCGEPMDYSGNGSPDVQGKTQAYYFECHQCGHGLFGVSRPRHRRYPDHDTAGELLREAD